MTLDTLESAATPPRAVAWALPVETTPKRGRAERVKSAEAHSAIMVLGMLEGATTSPRPTGGVFLAQDTSEGESAERVKSVEANKVFWLENFDVLAILDTLPKYKAPKPVTQPSAKSMITDRVQATLDKLLPLIERAAWRSYIQVSKVEVSGFVDPDDETKQVVVTQWINAPSYIALKYWDKLGLLIEDWIKSLPDELARIANERIAIEVLWLQQ